jgi:acetyltransferase-like isoleucine patch superfamily enzyme
MFASTIKPMLVKVWVELRLQAKRRKLTGIPHTHFGRGCKIDLFTEVEGHVKIEDFCNLCSSLVGRGTYITEHSVMRHTKIGRFCSIADHVMSGMGTYPVHGFVSTHPAFFNPNNAAGFSFCGQARFQDMPTVAGSIFAVEIGNDVWIGSGVRILNGV